jgi:hypothetical protein
MDMNTQPSLPLVHPNSLADTIDAVNAALFYEQPLSADVRAAAAAWIADRQGLPGSYAGMFAPTEHDYAFGALTFTGEPVKSGAGTGHMLSEESCRALLLLNVDAAEVREALRRARRGIFHRLQQSETAGLESGVYCCGTCSVALWRHMLPSHELADARRIEHGLSELNRHRAGDGRWKRFPFYYTLLALSEMQQPAAREEAQYAAPVIDRALRRLVKADPDGWSEHERRRKIVMERVLEMC